MQYLSVAWRFSPWESRFFGQSSFITPLGIAPATPHYPIKSNLRLSSYPFLDHIFLPSGHTKWGWIPINLLTTHLQVCVFFLRLSHTKGNDQMHNEDKIQFLDTDSTRRLLWQTQGLHHHQPAVTGINFCWQSTINCIPSGHPFNDVYPHRTQDLESFVMCVGKDMFWS